jgi:hypothetical protein
VVGSVFRTLQMHTVTLFITLAFSFSPATELKRVSEDTEYSSGKSNQEQGLVNRQQ